LVVPGRFISRKDADVTSDWRNTITLTFPVQRYHPPIRQPSGAVSLRMQAWLDAPRSIWGSHDGSDTWRHVGHGLSRNFDFPCKSECLPGGAIDSTGLHFPILDLDAPETSPVGLWKAASVLASLLRTHQYRFSFGEPEQLSLGEYKSRMTELNKKETGMPKTWRKIEKAESYYDAMMVDVSKVIMDAYYGPVEVKNWIDEPKRYLR
jgi:hypothetical protein